MAWLAGVFGALAVLLAIVGLYGLTFRSGYLPDDEFFHEIINLVGQRLFAGHKLMTGEVLGTQIEFIRCVSFDAVISLCKDHAHTSSNDTSPGPRKIR